MARKGEIPDPIFKEEKDKICDAFFGSSDDFYDSLSIGEFILEFLSSDCPCPNVQLNLFIKQSLLEMDLCLHTGIVKKCLKKPLLREFSCLGTLFHSYHF